MKSFLKRNYLLVLIVLLAIILRFSELSTIPIGFNDDEAAFGYNAYSIIKTARDEWGRFLPFPAFESFGDWKLVFYLYLVAASQLVFGIGEFSTRFPSALFGVLTVIATYFLAKKLFEDFTWKFEIPTIAALLLAISPWHIVASRNAFESDLLSFFITTGTLFFLMAQKNKKLLYVSTILFSICFYIYRSSWLFVPMFILVIFYLFRNNFVKAKEIITKNLILAAIVALPLLPVVLTFKGQSRFLQESFLTGVSRVGITNEVNERRGICQTDLPKPVCYLVYNKYLFFASIYIENYFKNLSWETFFDYSSPTGFQSFAKRGVLYLFELPILVAGIIFLLKSKSPAAKILIPWVLLAPVGAALTGIGNFGRINLIMPAPQIIAAFGAISLVYLIKNIRVRMATAALAILIISYLLTKLIVDLFYIEPYYTSRYQRYGYRQLFDYLATKDDYNQFVISRKIDNSHQYIQYLFSQKIDPKFLQENAKRIREKDGWVVFQQLGKFTFVPTVPGIESLPDNSLLVVGEKEVSYPIGPISTINYVNGDPAFLVYDVNEVKRKILEEEDK